MKGLIYLSSISIFLATSLSCSSSINSSSTSSAMSSSTSGNTSESIAGFNVTNSYKINSSFLLEDNSNVMYPKVAASWKAVIDVLPEGTKFMLPNITKVGILKNDGKSPGGLAYPSLDGTKWAIYLNEVSYGSGQEEEAKWVVAHEYGHTVSLNASNFSAEGEAPVKGSLYDDFYQKFWVKTGLLDKFKELNKDGSVDTDVEEKVINYINNSPLKCEFTSREAMVSPEEDYAESFAAYVLNKIKNTGCGKNKIDWFKQNYNEKSNS